MKYDPKTGLNDLERGITMINTEKINIYMPEETKDKLDRDMEMFEIFKHNGWDVNKNQFLTLLIKGYYDVYVQENIAMRDKVMAALRSTSLSAKEIETAANAVIESVFDLQPGKRVGRNAKKLSLKPTKDIEGILESIENESDEFLSRYLCRMFMRYCEKPFHQRERIIFKEIYDKLQGYCQARQPLNITVSSGDIRMVIPYCIAVGREEMFNYLLCQEVTERDNRAMAFALHRIRNININRKKESIDPIVRKRLDCMVRLGAEYALNDVTQICVQLNKRGIREYHRIYFGRPLCERIE